MQPILSMLVSYYFFQIQYEGAVLTGYLPNSKDFLSADFFFFELPIATYSVFVVLYIYLYGTNVSCSYKVFISFHNSFVQRDEF